MVLLNLFLSLCFTSLVMATPKIDKKETLNGVEVSTAKSDDVRTYFGKISKTFPHSLNTVMGSITNFSEKCNNSYKGKREILDKQMNCKYHNDNLVETVIIKDLKEKNYVKEPFEIERYVLGRRIYNRGSFSYYELVQVFEKKNEQDQKTIIITLKMLSDKAAARFITPDLKNDSAFDDSKSTFTLVQVKPEETLFNYEYESETDHWILNKEVSVPQVFSSMSKSINDLIKTVSAESAILGRDVASF